jgi:hypothetical protein
MQIRPLEGNPDRKRQKERQTERETDRDRKGTVIGPGLRPIDPNKAVGMYSRQTETDRERDRQR